VKRKTFIKKVMSLKDDGKYITKRQAIQMADITLKAKIPYAIQYDMIELACSLPRGFKQLREAITNVCIRFKLFIDKVKEYITKGTGDKEPVEIMTSKVLAGYKEYYESLEDYEE
jgi:hypothetical protein